MKFKLSEQTDRRKKKLSPKAITRVPWPNPELEKKKIKKAKTEHDQLFQQQYRRTKLKMEKGRIR
jgi:hypothetical protein